jgi:hypothetical protein
MTAQTHLRRLAAGATLVLVSAILVGCAAMRSVEISTAPDTLTAFRSDIELGRYMRRWIPAPPPRPPHGSSGAAPVEEILITGSLISGVPSITNNQEEGVDEGDIVKLRGDTLVILRRGRLFTVSIAGGKMRPIDSINAYPPGIDASDDWYDEMLVRDDRIVVIGYSYTRGTSEINRFTINRAGHLSFLDNYQLRSNDYYSSENYASRLVGNELVLYSTMYLPRHATNPLTLLPSMRRWQRGEAVAPFHRIVSSTQTYAPPVVAGAPEIKPDAVHTVLRCDLLAHELDCSGTSVFGPEGRSFYVSATAVYVWAVDYWPRNRAQDERSPSLVTRLPFDGGAPTAVAARGAPTDQFSFQESGDTLNVLVRAEAAGDAMWASLRSEGAVALLRIPISLFGNGTRELDLHWYRPLPTPQPEDYFFTNRFVGSYVLYGVGHGWDAPETLRSELIVGPVAGGEVTQFALDHFASRIEAMGRDAVVVGSDETNVTFSTIDLSSGERPLLGDRYVRAEAAEAETRSHAFFFRADTDGDSGVLGLPIARPARESYWHLFETSASMLFLRRADKRLASVGELDSQAERIVDDNCVASCVDWYGNARPIFIGDRVFALLGYELVEGALGQASFREVARVNFAPGASRVARRN